MITAYIYYVFSDLGKSVRIDPLKSGKSVENSPKNLEKVLNLGI